MFTARYGLSTYIKQTRFVFKVLTTGILSEKCVVSRFRRCANVIECTYTNLDSITYYIPVYMV